MKLIKKYGMSSIDKQEIDELIAARKFIGLNNCAPYTPNSAEHTRKYLPLR